MMHRNPRTRPGKRLISLLVDEAVLVVEVAEVAEAEEVVEVSEVVEEDVVVEEDSKRKVVRDAHQCDVRRKAVRMITHAL